MLCDSHGACSRLGGVPARKTSALDIFGQRGGHRRGNGAACDNLNDLRAVRLYGRYGGNDARDRVLDNADDSVAYRRVRTAHTVDRNDLSDPRIPQDHHRLPLLSRDLDGDVHRAYHLLEHSLEQTKAQTIVIEQLLAAG